VVKEPGKSTLAEKIDRLFNVVRRPDREPYSNQEVAKACRDIGFNGPYVIESFTNKVKSIARAAAIWRNFAPTQDALAEDGLKFLRKLLA